MFAGKFSSQFKKGFTLIELVVVVAVIALITAALYANYSAIDNRGKILAVAAKLKEDLNMAQSYSLAGQANSYNRPDGWGVNFNRQSNKYIIFSDLNKSFTYDYPTKLLIHGTETVSGGRFTESSMSAATVTVNGNATQVGTPGMPNDNNGYWSFDGVGDFLSLDSTAAAFADVGSEDFALDLWIRPATTGAQMSIFMRGNGGGTRSYSIYQDVTDKVVATIYGQSGAAYTASSTTSVVADTWMHVAVMKEKNILRMAVNGAVEQSTKMTEAVRPQTAAIAIGISDDTASEPWSGLLDEIRFSRGTGRWFEKFSVPTVMYKADDELLREIKLPPGIIFERLYIDSAGYDEVNSFFNPTNYILYANAAVPTLSVQIKLNNAGVESTGYSADAPKSLQIMPSGLVQWY